MKKLLLLLVIVFALVPHLFAQTRGYNSNLKKLNKKPKGSQPVTVKQMVPVETPWEYFGSFPYMTNALTVKSDQLIQFAHHDTSLLNSLCGWVEEVTVLDLTQSASLQLPFITASENGEKYMVIYQFKKFTNVDSDNVRLQVGLEVRLVASFSTLKGAVNLTLSNLGAAASAGKLSGTITLSCDGFSLPKIGEAFTVTSAISTETIEKVLQQVATLKSVVYDPADIIEPYVIGIQSLDSTRQEQADWQSLQKKAVQVSAGMIKK